MVRPFSRNLLTRDEVEAYTRATALSPLQGEEQYLADIQGDMHRSYKEQLLRIVDTIPFDELRYRRILEDRDCEQILSACGDLSDRALVRRKIMVTLGIRQPLCALDVSNALSVTDHYLDQWLFWHAHEFLEQKGERIGIRDGDGNFYQFPDIQDIERALGQEIYREVIKRISDAGGRPELRITPFAAALSRFKDMWTQALLCHAGTSVNQGQPLVCEHVDETDFLYEFFDNRRSIPLETISKSSFLNRGLRDTANPSSCLGYMIRIVDGTEAQLPPKLVSPDGPFHPWTFSTPEDYISDAVHMLEQGIMPDTASVSRLHGARYRHENELRVFVAYYRNGQAHMRPYDRQQDAQEPVIGARTHIGIRV